MNLSGKPRPIDRKNIRQIAKEWDAVAEARDYQIRTGKDISYQRILIPEIVKLIREANLIRVLDAGCGSGFLTELIGTQAAFVLGVDVSRVSIEFGIERALAVLEILDEITIEEVQILSRPQMAIGEHGAVREQAPILPAGSGVEHFGCLVPTCHVMPAFMMAP